MLAGNFSPFPVLLRAQKHMGVLGPSGDVCRVPSPLLSGVGLLETHQNLVKVGYCPYR